MYKWRHEISTFKLAVPNIIMVDDAEGYLNTGESKHG
jgi:hypothetical protein